MKQRVEQGSSRGALQGDRCARNRPTIACCCCIPPTAFHGMRLGHLHNTTPDPTHDGIFMSSLTRLSQQRCTPLNQGNLPLRAPKSGSGRLLPGHPFETGAPALTA